MATGTPERPSLGTVVTNSGAVLRAMAILVLAYALIVTDPA